VQAPGVDLLVEFLFQTLEAFGVLVDRSHVFLEDDLLGGGGTDHLGEPSEMGRTPICLAGIADIFPEQEGFETELGILKIAEGIFVGTGESPHGFIFFLGDIDGVRSPERISRANGTAFRRSVFTRSLAVFGMREGATTQPS
jgi:hypothetical protein